MLDNTGKGMFDRIMFTQLQPEILVQYRISEPCINLLVSMLNTDPSQRPTSYQCLQYSWFTPLGITQQDEQQSPRHLRGSYQTWGKIASIFQGDVGLEGLNVAEHDGAHHVTHAS